MTQELEYELEATPEQALYEPEAEWENEFEAEQQETALEQQHEAEPEIIGPDTRVRVAKTTAAPFRYICNLEYDRFPGVRRAPMCTGTLIGPSTVLTAGHCLSGFIAGGMRVIPGRDGTLEPLPATRALSLQVAPGFSPATPTDYGVIQLKDPIGIKIGYWSLAHRLGHADSIGTSISARPLPLTAGKLKVNVSGYPADKPGDPRFGCIDPRQPGNRCSHSLIGNAKRSLLCGSEQWRAFDRFVSSKGGILEYLDDTCPGHSGSPVWVRRDASLGGRVLIGIHVSGDQPPRPVANRGVRITQPILKNIQIWLANAPVPPPFRILDRFQFNKADLQPSHLTVIQAIAQRIVARASTPRRVRTVYLVGHADSRGTSAYNLALGRQRASVVRARLTASLQAQKPGLANTIRFVIESAGETQPRFTTTTEDGRSRNRRVEVMLGRI